MKRRHPPGKQTASHKSSLGTNYVKSWPDICTPQIVYRRRDLLGKGITCTPKLIFLGEMIPNKEVTETYISQIMIFPDQGKSGHFVVGQRNF